MLDKQELLKRLLERSIPEPNSGCWLWLASVVPGGYGQMWNGDKNVRAPRLSYLLHKGDFDPSLIVMHKCDNPFCINPDHLTVGSYSDNMVDMVNKGRHVYAHRLTCKRGHPLVTENIRVSTNTKNGRHFRRCITCMQEDDRATNPRIQKPKKDSGVNYDKPLGLWRARITINGRERFLGHFEERDAAIEARKKAEIEHGRPRNGRPRESWRYPKTQAAE